ncbi:MAG: quinolinate synthase NadA [Syntrophales bacterium]|nr:quinolinate synthase NadA [Syntrophales bacterium]MDD5233875.1 quinolinate synthase NadA [Syntrophales bacterium]MDD5531483.1 quinolinate synthase NadA [Syntrophales bacterium]
MNQAEKIKELKKKNNAVILAHNYQLPEVQDIADYVGDSLSLSIQAAKTEAAMIIFCGVYFMAETAKILSPGKTVLIPDVQAGCPMADMITAEQMRKLKAEHPGAAALCYVNTSADVKAECDMCCTSANAVRVVREGLKDRNEIIFVPDRYLAAYASAQSGRKFITWEGYCPIHAEIFPAHVLSRKSMHPNAEVLVHPECRPEVISLADRVLSTEGMCVRAKKSPASEFILATEKGILHRIRKENPGKKFYPASDAAICPTMKITNLERIVNAFENREHEVILSQEVMDKARISIENMLRY